jgi:hypothetical protein
MIAASFGNLRPDLVGDGTPLCAGGFGGVLGEGRNEGRDHPPSALAGMGQDIPLKMHAAALPGRAQAARIVAAGCQRGGGTYDERYGPSHA